MRINYDLIREILLSIEEVSDGFSQFTYEYIFSIISNKTLNTFSKDEFEYHVRFELKERGFVKASMTQITDLTPTGRDYLNTVRDNKVWDATKIHLNKTLSSVSIDVVAEVAKKISLRFLGLD